MRFNPVRFEELLSFAGTLCCAWVMSSLLIGGYRTHATSGADLGTRDLLQACGQGASLHKLYVLLHCCAVCHAYLESLLSIMASAAGACLAEYQSLHTPSTQVIGSRIIKGVHFASAAADLRTALARTAGAWLIAMPVAACQLVLVTACEGRTLIGDSLFAHVLPLAASGSHQHKCQRCEILAASCRCFF